MELENCPFCGANVMNCDSPNNPLPPMTAGGKPHAIDSKSFPANVYTADHADLLLKRDERIKELEQAYQKLQAEHIDLLGRTADQNTVILNLRAQLERYEKLLVRARVYEPDVCANCSRPYDEHGADTHCSHMSNGSKWFPRKLAQAICEHQRLNEDGYCRKCGADCGGIHWA